MVGFFGVTAGEDPWESEGCNMPDGTLLTAWENDSPNKLLLKAPLPPLRGVRTYLQMHTTTK
jgi:hypothetical protein